MQRQIPRFGRQLATAFVATAGLLSACHDGAAKKEEDVRPAKSEEAAPRPEPIRVTLEKQVLTSLVTGQAAVWSFPVPPSVVRAVAEKGPVIEAPLAATGDFLIEVPEGDTYRLELAGSDQTYPLVFPRGGTAFEADFLVRSEATAFELGRVRFVGDVYSRSFVVRNLLPEDDEAPFVKCANGIEKGSGALCVDNELASADVCGFDLETYDAAPCDEGEICGGEEPPARLPTSMPDNAAVPEQNLPAALGCGVSS